MGFQVACSFGEVIDQVGLVPVERLVDEGYVVFGGGFANRGERFGDLFHMNIEEANVPQAIRDAAPHVGHVHFADSNRSAIGFGHTDIQPIVDALTETGYTGYLAAEVFPLPDPQSCAAQTIASFRNVTGA